MKVKREIIEAAILKLITQISNTMPNSMTQFIFGGATTFATMKSSNQLGQYINYISDENGLVDVDMLEKLVEGSFKASNGKISFELFKDQGLMSLFLKPVTVTITKEDIDSLINEIKQNPAVNEVKLSTPPILPIAS